MTKLSQAIFTQLSSLSPRPPSAPTSPGGRTFGLNAPISSSRDDPRPNETFPAPLPPVILPYELNLLDNLFLNPMAVHAKASEYTDGKNRPGFNLPSGAGASVQATVSGSAAAFGNSNQEANGKAPSAPLEVYGLSGPADGSGSNGQTQRKDVGEMYDPALASMGPENPLGRGMNGNAEHSHAHDFSLGNAEIANGGPGDGLMGNGGGGGMDLFSFLMDDDSGFGAGGNWENLEIPADFSTIS